MLVTFFLKLVIEFEPDALVTKKANAVTNIDVVD